MNNRICAVRKHFKLTQETFAARLGLSRNFIWMVERGDRVPSDRTIQDICDKFHVSEDWLRYGEGEMFPLRTREDEIESFLGQVADGPDNFKKRLVGVLSRLDEKEWEIIEEMARRLAEEAEQPDQET